jgi:hypothetical protein
LCVFGEREVIEGILKLLLLKLKLELTLHLIYIEESEEREDSYIMIVRGKKVEQLGSRRNCQSGLNYMYVYMR